MMMMITRGEVVERISRRLALAGGLGSRCSSCGDLRFDELAGGSAPHVEVKMRSQVGQ